MRGLEQLSCLSAGGIDHEPKIGSTAPAKGLRGVEIAATLRGLTLFEERLVWVKYVGETGFLPDLHRAFLSRVKRHEGIDRWLTQRRATASAKAKRVANFDQACRWILTNHLRDYRCQVCHGVAEFEGIKCEHCGGSGVNPLEVGKLSRLMGISRSWCYDARIYLDEARSVLIRAENSAIGKIVENNRG